MAYSELKWSIETSITDGGFRGPVKAPWEGGIGSHTRQGPETVGRRRWGGRRGQSIFYCLP